MSGDKMSEGKILEGKMSGGVNCPFTYVCQPSKKQKIYTTRNRDTYRHTENIRIMLGEGVGTF